MYSIKKLLILQCLSNGETVALSRINNLINYTLGKHDSYSYIRNDIRDLLSKKYIMYREKPVLEKDNKNYIKITSAGLEYYNRIKKEFLLDFETRKRIKEDIERRGKYEKRSDQ